MQVFQLYESSSALKMKKITHRGLKVAGNLSYSS